MPLPVVNRLPLRKERDRLQKEGKTFHTSHFTLISATSPSQRTLLVGSPARRVLAGVHPVPRFSILLSKKTARLAVDRNLIRRRTSALLAELLFQFPPADYLVIPRRSILDNPHADLLADLSSLLSKLK